MPAGGLAVLRIRLLPMWGPPRNAVLQVNCALGKVPEERQTEGIRLTLRGRRRIRPGNQRAHHVPLDEAWSQRRSEAARCRG